MFGFAANCLVPSQAPAPGTRAAEMEVKLNIGGTLFTTTRATLIGSGPDNGSLLAIMFENDQPLGKKVIDGGIFFDRDGLLFSFVLAYLRDGIQQVDIIPDEKLVAVKIEAEFFQLAGKPAMMEGFIS